MVSRMANAQTAQQASFVRLICMAFGHSCEVNEKEQKIFKKQQAVIASILDYRACLGLSSPCTWSEIKRTGPLYGRVAVVTGASSGIGKAVAIALAASGAKVALGARRADLLQDVIKIIQSGKGEAIGLKTDVTSMEQVKTLVQAAESSLGPVDILVNCAGLMYYTLMKNLHVEEWDKQIDVNCKGVTNSIGAVLDGMLKRSKGHIVNISSDAGRRGFPGLAVYSGTKFFVEGMSQALRQELASTGVRVTCIQPGDVKTPLQKMSTDTEANQLYNGSDQVQILEVEDIARAVVYAVSQPSYVAINEILIEPREAPV
ncbi:linear gramicidin synthase subunit d-like [Plakobranchus ocellatus]|uniref:NADP-dependent 3-hydroxy acid dehydrogenase YdfG n=1 Tax=Plakobranchus ocellatus TaxID=259542 RepID=A0AAV3Z0F3_9GAST|nr:linear gramicidin synthase subunit d-like [Plakobranchus ocellatus]